MHPISRRKAVPPAGPELSVADRRLFSIVKKVQERSLGPAYSRLHDNGISVMTHYIS